MTSRLPALRPWHRLKSRRDTLIDAALRVNVGGGLGVSAVLATSTVNTAIKRWGLGRSAATAYARHAVYAMLHSSFGKADERVCATIQSPPCTITVESSKSGESRGFASPADGSQGIWSLDEGVLHVLEYLTGASTPHRSVVGFDGGVDGAWATFYDTSESSDVESILAVEMHSDHPEVEWAGGLCVRSVAPTGGLSGTAYSEVGENGAQQLSRLRRILCSNDTFASSDFRCAVGSSDSSATSREGLLRAVKEVVAKPLGLEILDARVETTPQCFFCPCGTRDHVGFVRKAIGAEDLAALLQEPSVVADGGVTVNCHMCNAAHLVPAAMLRDSTRIL